MRRCTRPLFYGGAAYFSRQGTSPMMVEKGNTSLEVFPFHKFVLVKRNERSFRNMAVSIIERCNETLESITMQQWEFGASSARSSLVAHFRLCPCHKRDKHGRIVRPLVILFNNLRRKARLVEDKNVLYNTKSRERRIKIWYVYFNEIRLR